MPHQTPPRARRIERQPAVKLIVPSYWLVDGGSVALASRCPHARM